jgi:hypothetical protein
MAVSFYIGMVVGSVAIPILILANPVLIGYIGYGL